MHERVNPGQADPGFCVCHEFAKRSRQVLPILIVVGKEQVLSTKAV